MIYYKQAFTCSFVIYAGLQNFVISVLSVYCESEKDEIPLLLRRSNTAVLKLV